MNSVRKEKKYPLGPLLGLCIMGCLTMTTPASAFTLHNAVTGFCLAVAGGNPNPGAAIIVWSCDGTPSQQWSLGDVTADGSLAGLTANTLVSAVVPNRVIGVQGGADVNPTPLITWTEDPPAGQFGVNNQGWGLLFNKTDANGHSCFQILNAGINRQNAFNMGVLGASTNQGAQVVVWQNPPFTGPTPDQIWCMYQTEPIE